MTVDASPKKLRIAINGFGRIGRQLTELISKSNTLDLVAINDKMPLETAVYLYRYDSVYHLKREISVHLDVVHMAHQRILYSDKQSILDLAWEDLQIDVIVHASGVSMRKEDLMLYQKFNPKHIILSQPSIDDLPIYMPQIFPETWTTLPQIFSMGSCTSYCVAPLLKFFQDHFEIKHFIFTSVHCYTPSQNLHDSAHNDLRRARAAAQNIIPTSTSATKVLQFLFPELQHKISSSSYRVPVINGSLTEIHVLLRDFNLNKADFLTLLQNETKKNNWEHLLSMTDDPIVSSDMLSRSESCLIDIHSLDIRDNLVSLVSFYDNEASYCHRLMELFLKI
ncbi:MAG: hypothetical protein MUE53_08920 [Chitinophagales bacterium]|jgi:glyceraldehyde 3-phosphate dehydrogenase|nr:hypothetical protein [Chitinophagales bacterium]